MKYLLFILALLLPGLLQAQQAHDLKMIARATPYFGTLNEAVDVVWPDAPRRSFFGAQVERESLWNPQAQLCVPKPTCSRERGIGLGQMTITPRFNVFTEVQQLHPLLRDWQPKDYFDPRLQLIAIVAKDRQHYRQCTPLMANPDEILACAMSAYNGGFGGFSADRRLCSNTKGCEPTKWFGHVEHTSLKAKTALQGYGKSFFQINRGYVCEVVVRQAKKYSPYLIDQTPLAVTSCTPL